MNTPRTVFAQLLDGIRQAEFERCVEEHPMVRKPRSFSAYDHFACMVFAQLTHRQSLRDLETCLNARPELLYHAGIRGRVSRCNLAYANEHRDWRVFALAAEVLMRRARRATERPDAVAPVDADILAFDASLIDVSLALCPWAHRQQSQAAVRLNVLLDVAVDLPRFASVTAGDQHEVGALDELPLYPGSYYIMDRGYLDFRRLHRLQRHGAFFVGRARSNLRFRAVRCTQVDKTKGLRCDQTITLRRAPSARAYPEPLRRIRYVDPEHGHTFVFLTNQFALDATVITELYRRRWQVELFFRWIKQHLSLRAFFATSPNGVRLQVWSALCAHLLVAIAQQRLALPGSLYQILQLTSVCIWEKSSLSELLTKPPQTDLEGHTPNQLIFSGF